MSELNEVGRRVPELGRIELLQVRDVWQDEARAFTPWLKDNLRLLGEALEMELDALGRETPWATSLLTSSHRYGERNARSPRKISWGRLTTRILGKPSRTRQDAMRAS